MLGSSVRPAAPGGGDLVTPYYGGGDYSRGPGVPFGIRTTWTRTVKWLIGINVGVYVLQLMIISRGGGQGLEQFWAVFAMVPGKVLNLPPYFWQVVTYMFLHAGAMHLFGNMLGLFFFAGDVERELGTRRFLWFYFACGVSGALLSCLLNPQAMLVGASAGVLGVVVAFAIYYPNAIVYLWMLILIPVRVKYLAIGYAVLTVLLAAEGGRSGIAHWGHLGGMAYAFVYLYLFPRWGVQVRLPRWLSSPASGWSERWQRRQAQRRAYRKAAIQEELDRILAKVHQEGLPSLTDSERRFLKKVSKRF